MEYIIVGDTESFNDCLIKVLLGHNLEQAQNALHRFLTKPTEDEKRDIKKYKNIRIKETESGVCWWHDSFLAN